MILAIRTDKPEAELRLIGNGKEIDSYSWQAHRELADTILKKIDQILVKNQASIKSLEGIIIFTGNGSFTGLRIGTTVANSLSYGLDIPIASAEGEEWVEQGVQNLKSTKIGEYVIPKYNAEPNITQPKSSSA